MLKTIGFGKLSNEILILHKEEKCLNSKSKCHSKVIYSAFN